MGNRKPGWMVNPHKWNQIRGTHVTAHSAATAFDRFPFETRKANIERRCYEKVFGKIERPETEPMREGTAWEPRLIEMSKPDVLGFQEGLTYASHDYATHPEYPWIGAKPDQLIHFFDVSTGELLAPVGGLEVKKQFKWAKKGPADWVPTFHKVWYYWVQMQVSMHVFSVTEWDFFVSNGDWSAHEKIVRDDAWWHNEALPAFKEWMLEYERTLMKYRLMAAQQEKSDVNTDTKGG